MKKFRILKKQLFDTYSGKLVFDETWVNAGHTVSKVWTGTTVTTARNAFIAGQLVFESKQTKDYHEEMNAQVFEEWFENILPSLENGCVIVLDNASYHTRKLDKTPTSATKKGDIQNWLMTLLVHLVNDLYHILFIMNDDKSRTFEINLKPLLDQAVQNVSPQNWKNAVAHIIKEEERMWTLDDLMEIQVEPLIINVGEGDDKTSSDSEKD
ncbi:uncharacterized protein LOC126750570 [Anthonomus grandis grandis]|uniref:uncharacterized protein LOC126750570 n=1 Tax=Anthonomus grandis grandis TaxID=2921223 RepID=UPI002165813F|nr:uncharacterized protein LOC126750570 [Anthonomus grandis grandis]